MYGNSTGVWEIYHMGDKQHKVSLLPVFYPRNTLTYITGITADSCCLMIMMMVIVGDRSVA